jgi:hypothetical protein
MLPSTKFSYYLLLYNKISKVLCMLKEITS